MKERRKARELALQALYACEMSNEADPGDLLAYVAEEQAIASEAQRYARALALKTLESRERIDELLRTHAANWELKRMAAIDRNILRMAVAELLFFPDVPYRVVMDEAVEIAKRFGTDDSGKFVNGVLDAIFRKLSLGGERRTP
jgi:transcription antitermination protein NusB